MILRRKLFIAVGIVLALAILLPVIHHYQLASAEASYIAKLKAQGEPMELAQLVPPAVPADQNSADAFLKALALFEAGNSLLQTNYFSGMKMVAPGKAVPRFQEPKAEGYFATNSWEEVAAAVGQDGKAFELLQQLIDRPHLDFQIHYEREVGTGFNFNDFHLVELKLTAQKLATAGISDLHQGDTTAAVKNLRALFGLTQAMDDEHLFISELMQIAVASIAVPVTWEVLQSPDITDEQLAQLENGWNSLDFIQDAGNALEMDRAMEQLKVAQWRTSNQAMKQVIDEGRTSAAASAWDEAKDADEIFMWRHWWSYPDQLRRLKGDEVMLETVRDMRTNHAFQALLTRQTRQLDAVGMRKVLIEPLGQANPNMHTWLSQSIPTLGSSTRRLMRIETARQVVIAAIALKRYQLKMGSYPPDLDSLVPGFVSGVPFDPVDGQPLRYRPKTDGTFLLYSVGDNGVDDGGNPQMARGATGGSIHWQNDAALDWVWPQPSPR